MSHPKLSLRDALARLQAGNRRFCAGIKSIEFLSSNRRMPELAENGQNPFATVLTCSDSRLPIEQLFDCGVGELFVIRVAGNILTPEVIGSIEFAVTSLGTPLCLIMGHTQCGAVTASIDSELYGIDTPSRSLASIVERIRPAVSKAMKAHPLPGDLFKNRVIIENVRLSAESLPQESQVLQTLHEQGLFHIVPALCDLSSGKIEFLDASVTERNSGAYAKGMVE